MSHTAILGDMTIPWRWKRSATTTFSHHTILFGDDNNGFVCLQSDRIPSQVCYHLYPSPTVHHRHTHHITHTLSFELLQQHFNAEYRITKVGSKQNKGFIRILTRSKLSMECTWVDSDVQFGNKWWIVRKRTHRLKANIRFQSNNNNIPILFGVSMTT